MYPQDTLKPSTRQLWFLFRFFLHRDRKIWQLATWKKDNILVHFILQGNLALSISTWCSFIPLCPQQLRVSLSAQNSYDVQTLIQSIIRPSNKGWSSTQTFNVKCKFENFYALVKVYSRHRVYYMRKKVFPWLVKNFLTSSFTALKNKFWYLYPHLLIYT